MVIPLFSRIAALLTIEGRCLVRIWCRGCLGFRIRFRPAGGNEHRGPLAVFDGYAKSLNNIARKSITDSPKWTLRTFRTVRVIYTFFMRAANNSVSHYNRFCFIFFSHIILKHNAMLWGACNNQCNFSILCEIKL